MADPYLRVHAVNIYVKDQARSLDFYLNTLGFHIAFDARVGSGERLLAVAPPDGSAVLTLIQAKPDSAQARLALVLRRAGNVERLEPTATVLGLFSTWECRTAELRLCAGDLLAIYTDGITEASFTLQGLAAARLEGIDVL
jgi:Stage II sporulation protein E (SpoIIE)/Glyoxalase/Bleomycin resistance protein/Dioxygenase superfamily